MANSMRCPMDSPWGHIQHRKEIADGIWSVSTAGHGGFALSDERLAEMPKFMREKTWAGEGWFEEDCDWSLVALCFPQYFSEYQLYSAASTLRGSHPERVDPFTATERGSAVMAKVDAFYKANAGRFQLGSMSTSGGGWSCSATTLDGSKRILFLSPEYPEVKNPFTLDDLRAAGVTQIKEAA